METKHRSPRDNGGQAPDGSLHKIPSVYEQQKQQAEIDSHKRLVQQQLGNVAPIYGNQRVPLYPAPVAQRPASSPMVPHPQFNTNSSTYEFYGDCLNLDVLTEHTRLALQRGAFNMECLVSHPEDTQILHDCGFVLSGIVGKNIGGQSVQLQRWRLLLQRSGDGETDAISPK